MQLTEEQRARIEQNRQEALARRARAAQQQADATKPLVEQPKQQVPGEEQQSGQEQVHAPPQEPKRPKLQETGGQPVDARVAAHVKSAGDPPASAVARALDRLRGASVQDAGARYTQLTEAIEAIGGGGAQEFKEAMADRLQSTIVSLPVVPWQASCFALVGQNQKTVACGFCSKFGWLVR
jgi:hypothetical protein